jgi:hypothetical protein
MNVFFEISDTCVEKYGHKYIAIYDADNVIRHGDRRRLYQIKAFSDRMWSEEDDGVKFIKNRRTEKNNTPVDMKEFFWIKLKSKTI